MKTKRHGNKAGAELSDVENGLKQDDVKAMQAADRSLAVAVEKIERNCGPDTRQLLAGRRTLTPKDISMLSRTSPEYQRHVLDRLRAGHAAPLTKTAACALVYETVSFGEVISRMERAVGAVRREVAFIVARIDAGAAQLDRGPDRLLTLALTVDAAEESAAGIRRLTSTEGTPLSVQRTRKLQREPAQDVSRKLNAASALGLLAKNVRNVPLLQPEHHPTAGERCQALDLCDEIVGIAKPALVSARRMWGNLDDQLWLRSPAQAMRRIITHADPDGDALAAAWLAERYLFAGESVDILFVPRERVLGCFRPGDCLVDVGNSFDPARYLFDHKPPALADRHDSCAAKLVWEYLLANKKPVRELEDFVLAVFAWDSVKRWKQFEVQATVSKKDGFHAAIDAARKLGLNNTDLYRSLRGWLDRAHPAQE